MIISCFKQYYEDKNILNVIITKLRIFRLLLGRFKFVNLDLKLKNNQSVKKLTKQQRKEVRAYWSQWYPHKIQIEWIEFYLSTYGKYNKRFIPNNIFHTYIDVFFTNPFTCSYIDDKNLYDILFRGIKMPRTILRKINGVYLDQDYKIISEQDFRTKCIQSSTSFIIKPSINSCGGDGIRFWNSYDNINDLIKFIQNSDNIIMQEVVSQHSSLAHLHVESLNTIRIMTFFFENKVHVLSTVVRMGVNGSKVDNVSAGGLACGINDDGRLKDYAFYANGEKVKQHPQGAVFSQSKIEHFIDCVQIAKQLALRLLSYSKLVSWDFSIDKEGYPVLIEVNLTFGQLDFHQMTNGPIFGDLTEKVLDTVFRRKL